MTCLSFLRLGFLGALLNPMAFNATNLADIASRWGANVSLLGLSCHVVELGSG